MERRQEEDNQSHTHVYTQPGSHQIVILEAVVASITGGLTESLPRCLSFWCCCGSQSALSHSLTLVPITQLYTVSVWPALQRSVTLISGIASDRTKTDSQSERLTYVFFSLDRQKDAWGGERR